MLFSNLEPYFFSYLVLVVVILANALGILARIKPIRNPYLHSLHHIFYFLVLLSTVTSIGHSFYVSQISISHLLLLGFMSLLPFFKKGKRIHMFLGVSALFCAIIPVVNKYFN